MRGDTSPCASCSSPIVVRRREYRHRSLCVFLGHALLVPAILVLTLGTMGVVAVQPLPPATPRQTAAALRSVEVPAATIEKVAACRVVEEPELAALTPVQRESVLRAQLAAAHTNTRSNLDRLTTGKLFRFLTLLALASGVAGWALTRKRTTLRCASCGAECSEAPQVGSASL